MSFVLIALILLVAAFFGLAAYEALSAARRRDRQMAHPAETPANERPPHRLR